jgi:arylsulfatase A-like enzyme
VVSCQRQPNIVVFLADDMGYGDLPITGHPTIDAPRITEMANEGLFLHQWYSGDILCSPSRAAMMTGQYAIRNGFYANFSFPLSSQFRVFYPTSVTGLNDVQTLPKVLKNKAGYATALHGKWHLGHRNGSLPTENGYDHFFGTPFAGNQGCDKWQNTSNIPNYLNSLGCQRGWAGLPLMEDTEVIEQPLYQPSYEQRLVKESINFLKKKPERKQTFFYHAFFSQYPCSLKSWT